MTIRHDYIAATIKNIRKDLKSLGLSENAAAEALGMSRSTLNAFMNGLYRKNQKRTLKALLNNKGWSPLTTDLLECLLAWDTLAISGALPSLTDLESEDHHKTQGVNMAAE